MADISQITLPSGTTYDIKDAVARAKAAISVKGNTKIFYTSCQTPASTAAKTMSCTDFDAATDLVSGTILFVFFETANDVDNITFEINNSGAKPVAVNASITATNKAWKSGEVGCFIFNETADFWIMVDSGQATTDYYGVTKLSNATNSTSQDLAATPKAVKDALDAAKAYADGLDTGVSDVKVNGTSVVASGVATINTGTSSAYGVTKLSDDYAPYNSAGTAVTPAGGTAATQAALMGALKHLFGLDNEEDSYEIGVTDFTVGEDDDYGHYLQYSTNDASHPLVRIYFNYNGTHIIRESQDGGSTWTETGHTLPVFKNIKVGSTNITADSSDDILELEAGNNITLTPDAANDKVTIAANYSEATTSAAGLMSSSDKTKLNGIAAGAEVNVQANWTQTTTTADDYIKNKPTLGAAAEKGVDTSIAASSTSVNLPTSAAVETRIQAAIAEAEVGSAAFQGVVNSNSAISGLSDYKKGWYWVVGTAGTYVGQTCEVGDFIFCVSDKASAYAAADFKVVQANIDMSQFGDLAFKDTATGSVSVTSSDAVTSVSHGLDSATASGDDTVLKDVTNAAPTFTGTQKYLHLSTTKGTVTSTGSASLTTSDAVTAVSGSVNTTSTNGIDIKPAGTVSTPTITVTPSTTTKYVASSATGGGTVTNGTAATFTATVSNENVTFGWTANTPTAVTLPSFSSQTIATGITSATSTQPSFTGTQKYLHLSTTKDTVTSTGSISVTTSGAVTAVSGSVNTTATDGIDIKPAGSVSAPTLTKTYVKPKVTATKGTTTSTGTVTVS
jgi:hypothetical protein